jgi:hypothetical protein
MHISLFEEGSKGERAEESLRFTFTIITSYKHLFLREREREREREMKTWREIARERDRNIRAAKA